MNFREVTLAGSSGPVRISRDPAGAAEIVAKSADDAMLGLGYCHARDRGLQMRLVRILGRGEASQRIGSSEEMLSIDRFFRRLNLRGDAETEAAALAPLAKSGVDAYCQGVNLGFERHGVPWELRLFGDRPGGDPWTFADVYLTANVIGYVGLALSQADMERWIVECVQHGFGRELLEELFPGQLQDLDEELLKKVKLQDPIIPEALWHMAALPLAPASNNWVVSGSKTASGQPIVANDPHLQIDRIPPFWYEAVLRWPLNDRPHYVMGATLPGAPGVILGRNPDVAWSVTYGSMDCIDSWVEDCRDGCYRRGDEWLPFRRRKETILRRSKSPEVVEFFENNHGTLEGDPREPGYYLATRWSCGEQTGASSLEGLLGMLEARTVEEGRGHLGRLMNSSWNWLLADRDGNIGYQMAGRMPIRREGVSGLVPLPGWDPANDWQGFAALDELPNAYNPPEGFLATANDDLNHLGLRKPINLCVPPYRANRIRSLLDRREGLTTEDMKAIQFDLYSLQAERFMREIRPLLDQFATVANAAILRDWDCRYAPESLGPTIFERFYRALVEEVFGGSSSDGNGPTLFGVPVVSHLIDEGSIMGEFYGIFDRVLLSEASIWFAGRSRTRVYETVLARILPAPARPYGETRQIVLKHLLFGGKLPRFLGFDRGPITLRGGRATVHQGQFLRSRGRKLASGPSYRMITDLSTDEIHTTLPGGPSDRPFSRWYSSGLSDWLNGKYKITRGLSPDQESIQRTAALEPSKTSSVD